MAVTLEAVKGYCRIDGGFEDELLLSLIDAAKAYLDNAGVPEPEGDVPIYDLAVKALVLEFYEHRGLTESGGMSSIRGLDNAIVQLKLVAEAERAYTAENQEVADGGVQSESGL